MPKPSGYAVPVYLVLCGLFLPPPAAYAGGSSASLPTRTAEAPALHHEAEPATAPEAVQEPSAATPANLSLTISYADRPAVVIGVPEGTVASYRDFSYDVSFGVVAYVDENDDVEIWLVSLAGERTQYRADQVLEVLRTKVGYEVVGTAGTALPVAIKADREAAARKSTSEIRTSATGCQPNIDLRGKLGHLTGKLKKKPGGGDTCCVTCEGGDYCGCTVSTPCGSCVGSCHTN